MLCNKTQDADFVKWVYLKFWAKLFYKILGKTILLYILDLHRPLIRRWWEVQWVVVSHGQVGHYYLSWRWRSDWCFVNDFHKVIARTHCLLVVETCPQSHRYVVGHDMFSVCAVVDHTFNLKKMCWYGYGCVLGSQAYRGISFFAYGYLNFTRSAFLYFSLSLSLSVSVSTYPGRLGNAIFQF